MKVYRQHRLRCGKKPVTRTEVNLTRAGMDNCGFSRKFHTQRRIRMMRPVPWCSSSSLSLSPMILSQSSPLVFILDESQSQCLGLAFDVVVHAISPLGEAVLTARLDEQFVHSPVVQLIDDISSSLTGSFRPGSAITIPHASTLLLLYLAGPL